jgi:hypothetical protein
VEKFAGGVIDTGGKFGAGVIETGGAPWLANILRIFEKFETVLMGYSGAGGKLIHEKNQKQKISWHCPFKLRRKSRSTIPLSGDNNNGTCMSLRHAGI